MVAGSVYKNLDIGLEGKVTCLGWLKVADESQDGFVGGWR